MALSMQKILGWRKFALTVIVVITSTILLICDIIKGDQWVDLMKVIIPVFLGANLIEHWRRIKDGNPPNIGPTP